MPPVTIFTCRKWRKSKLHHHTNHLQSTSGVHALWRQITLKSDMPKDDHIATTRWAWADDNSTWSDTESRVANLPIEEKVTNSCSPAEVEYPAMADARPLAKHWPPVPVLMIASNWLNELLCEQRHHLRRNALIHMHGTNDTYDVPLMCTYELRQWPGTSTGIQFL